MNHLQEAMEELRATGQLKMVVEKPSVEQLISRALLIQSELEEFITEFSQTEKGQGLSVDAMALLYMMVKMEKNSHGK